MISLTITYHFNLKQVKIFIVIKEPLKKHFHTLHIKRVIYTWPEHEVLNHVLEQSGVNQISISSLAQEGNLDKLEKPLNINARYIRVWIRYSGGNNGHFLSLAEVQVFGEFIQPSGPLVNLALRKPARQISTWSNYGAKLAVDGLTSNSTTSFNHTNRAPEPFWEVDLGNQAQIEEVVVYNRTDPWSATYNRISGFYILISPNPFQQNRLSGYLGDGITTV